MEPQPGTSIQLEETILETQESCKMTESTQFMDYETLWETLFKTYVQDQNMVSSLSQMAIAESDGEKDEKDFEDTPSPSRGCQVLSEAGQVLDGPENNSNRRIDVGEVIMFLCTNRAFTEAEAMALFSETDEGINFICSKQYKDNIRTYIHIARITIFQESIKQRFERAKLKFENDNPRLMNEHVQEETRLKFLETLRMNDIDLNTFFEETFKHFMRQNGQKNNLFFTGPPSTGKTMIMASLVECHFNFCRLTALKSNSSFNFSGLLHTNACLMDECKLTKHQFEQWKLLASGLPMSTDVKYRDRCDVKDCVLYTCSDYPIEMYCNVPMAQQAVMSRTVQFNLKKQCPWYIKISPHIWEKCWGEYIYKM